MRSLRLLASEESVSQVEREQAFWLSLADAEKERVSKVLSWSPLFYLAFCVLDWLVFRDHFLDLFLIRAAFAGVCLACLRRVRRCKKYKSVMTVTIVAFSAACFGIVGMCHLTGGVSSPYYVGLILCFLFAAALFTWPTWISFISFSLPLFLLFSPYLLGYGDLGLREVSPQAFFLTSSLFIAMIGMNTRNNLAFQGFLGEQAIAQRNRELASLHELKDRMFQNVSHELRTPLTLMMTPLQRQLERETSSADEKRWAREMYRNGMRLSKQINDLLDLARLDADGVVTKKEVVEVGAFLRSVVDDLRHPVAEAGLSIDLCLNGEPTFYLLDPSHLEQVLLNLLGNSVKFTPAGGRITVSVFESESGLEISVEDTGPGIPQEQHKRIFDRFQQVEDGSTRRYGGSGIGLALVDELMELMGGGVDLKSEEGQGSRFTIRFPSRLAVHKSDLKVREEVIREGMNLCRRADREVMGERTTRRRDKRTAGSHRRR
jgi:signal transduction histidine kinase